jgi:hypothetical protein
MSCSPIVSAQKASDVLENGIRVKPGEKIFLQFIDNRLKYDIAKSLQDVCNPLDFTTFEDSVIFLVSKNAVNVYIRPLNPLNYTVNTETKEITDPVNEAASSAFSSILTLLSKTGINLKVQPRALEATKPFLNTCEGFLDIVSNLDSIQNMLQKNQKDDLIKLFRALRELSFTDEPSTISYLDNIAKSMEPFEAYYAIIDSLIDQTGLMIKNYSCDTIIAYVSTYIINSIFKDLKTAFQEQKKRLKNLQNAFNLVKEAQTKASVGGGETGLKWCTKLEEVPSKSGKISLFTVNISKAGYRLSDKNEIICSDSKNVIKRSMRIMKFQRFVPEVSVGTAYTFFTYNTYGTVTDSTGQQYIATPTVNSVRNLKITTMINFNYYIPNSPIHPSYQIGVGLNSEIPTLITGLGIRSNIGSIRRLTISGGIAMTWLKELDTLREGDLISGSDDIEKDLKYKFSWPPKPYIGLQYNF